MVRHRVQDATYQLVREPAGLGFWYGEPWNPACRIRGVRSVQAPVQRMQRLPVVIAGRRRVAPPKLGQSCADFGGLQRMTGSMRKTVRPPAELPSALLDEAWAVHELTQERLNVGVERSRRGRSQS